jgi:hypothetical protein
MFIIRELLTAKNLIPTANELALFIVTLQFLTVMFKAELAYIPAFCTVVLRMKNPAQSRLTLPDWISMQPFVPGMTAFPLRDWFMA